MQKRALSGASRGSLVHFANKFDVDDAETELFMSPNLRSCHLVSTPEEKRFMAGVCQRICTLEAELMLSWEKVDDLTEDIEVSAVRSMMLARAMQRCSCHIETDPCEKVKKLRESWARRKGVKRTPCERSGI